jgi:hypothetical protein
MPVLSAQTRSTIRDQDCHRRYADLFHHASSIKVSGSRSESSGLPLFRRPSMSGLVE